MANSPQMVIRVPAQLRADLERVARRKHYPTVSDLIRVCCERELAQADALPDGGDRRRAQKLTRAPPP